MTEIYGDATLGEMKKALALYHDDELLNVELTGEWYSYRGYYDQVAIGYAKRGCDFSTVSQLRNVIDAALKTGVMEGYKGGEYSIYEHTNFCFCAAYNETGGLYATSISADFDGVKISVREDE